MTWIVAVEEKRGKQAGGEGEEEGVGLLCVFSNLGILCPPPSFVSRPLFRVSLQKTMDLLYPTADLFFVEGWVFFLVCVECLLRRKLYNKTPHTQTNKKGEETHIDV